MRLIACKRDYGGFDVESETKNETTAQANPIDAKYNGRLVVRLKLRRGLDSKLYASTHFATMLSLLGESFRDGKESYTHGRLMAYLERKGSMEYSQPVSKSASLPNRNKTATLLVGDTKNCHTCRLCPACQKPVSKTECRHKKIVCKCPFPRRQVPWGKVECEQDKASCDKLQQMLAMKHERGEITITEYSEKYHWIERMSKRCDSKLFAIRQRMVESEGIVDPKRTKAGVGRNVESMGKGLVLG